MLPGFRTGTADGDALLVRRVRSERGTVLLLDRAGQALSLGALRLLGLTEREATVVHGLARGGSTEALATELAISPRTVAKHVQRINAKLGARNRAQAIATASAAAGGRPGRPRDGSPSR